MNSTEKEDSLCPEYCAEKQHGHRGLSTCEDSHVDSLQTKKNYFFTIVHDARQQYNSGRTCYLRAQAARERSCNVSGVAGQVAPSSLAQAPGRASRVPQLDGVETSL